ncbi:zinc-binding dehydrogenase [Xylariales sp. PMI_506]|nr:zinc-binding dehydrogenase [Xylariales sp. PMI_506]
MKAVLVLGDTSSPRVALGNHIPKPSPGDDELLIKVHAAGVTGDELTWPELYRSQNRIPGHEVSGTVAALGSRYIGPLRLGDEVYGFLGADRGGGGQAEYVVCSADEVALKPQGVSRGVTHAEAAALPIPLLTAWEALAEHWSLAPGGKILVTGASGAVGRLFVQLAAKLGPGGRVIALAGASSRETLERLGASEVLDYETPGWERRVAGVDLVFDTVGGDVLTKTWETINDNGTMVTVADPPPAWAFSDDPPAELSKHPNVRYKYFIVSPNVERLKQASEMINNGSIELLPIKTFPLREAEQAWHHAGQRRRGYKVVIDMASED